jgi:hypothetical protein
MEAVMGRYRWRTWLRGRLPSRLAGLVPKGRRDCGAHEWYRSEPGTWRCYHCEAGLAHVSPWSEAEGLELRLAALDLRHHALEQAPMTRETLEQRLALARETEAELARLLRAPRSA